MNPRLALSRSQIISFRRRACCLDERLPAGEQSLRKAAWAGLQDSVPRAALLSIHARVHETGANDWEHPSLVQLWGPRFNDYVVAARDLAVFSLGRLPDDAARRARAHDTAERLYAFLQGQKMPFGQAGRGMGVAPNSLRYAAATGRVLLRWDGSRQPLVWTTPPSEMEPAAARLELARRYLQVFGPGTPASFARWAGIGLPSANAVWRSLAGALTAVRTPAGDAWILTEDEAAFRAKTGPSGGVRLLPSGDAFFLAWGANREILVPDARRQAELWTTRVWPGALLVAGEIAGVWRRAGALVSIDPWRRLAAKERAAVEAEAARLPLPGIQRDLDVQWNEASDPV
ncbi:MAG: winged helix DNA-binding domain-containing protein [Acidobacteria bacterium]|nr:winged helix DNA-binding domain-containing protein [Acidobacteriota bacterium]